MLKFKKKIIIKGKELKLLSILASINYVDTKNVYTNQLGSFSS